MRNCNHPPDLRATVAGNWWVYIIEASDGSYYTGITTDVARRWQEHRSGARAAKYFRGRKPRALVFVEGGHSRSSASRREVEIKALTRADKVALIRSTVLA